MPAARPPLRWAPGSCRHRTLPMAWRRCTASRRVTHWSRLTCCCRSTRCRRGPAFAFAELRVDMHVTKGTDVHMPVCYMYMYSALERGSCLALLSAIIFHRSYFGCASYCANIKCAVHCLGSGSPACWRRCHVTARVGASAPRVNGPAADLAQCARSCCASGHIGIRTVCSAAPHSAPGPLAPSLGQPSDRIAPPAGRYRAPRLNGVDGHAVWLPAAHHWACRWACRQVPAHVRQLRRWRAAPAASVFGSSCTWGPVPRLPGASATGGPAQLHQGGARYAGGAVGRPAGALLGADALQHVAVRDLL